MFKLCQVASGKRLQFANWKNHLFLWVNQRTKWAIFNSKLLVYQRVYTVTMLSAFGCRIFGADLMGSSVTPLVH